MHAYIYIHTGIHTYIDTQTGIPVSRDRGKDAQTGIPVLGSTGLTFKWPLYGPQVSRYAMSLIGFCHG